MDVGLGGFVLCMRVLTMSRGWTTRVETAPALRPAMDSTAAGETPALLLEGIKANCRSEVIYMVVVVPLGKIQEMELQATWLGNFKSAVLAWNLCRTSQQQTAQTDEKTTAGNQSFNRILSRIIRVAFLIQNMVFVQVVGRHYILHIAKQLPTQAARNDFQIPTPEMLVFPVPFYSADSVHIESFFFVILAWTPTREERGGCTAC